MKLAYEANDILGSYILGEIYANGKYCEKDYENAFECFYKSGELGYSQGYYYAGKMYEYGLCIDVNYELALECYSKAYELNDTRSCYALEKCIY